MARDWTDTYTTQVCSTFAPWGGMTRHLKIRRRDGKDTLIRWETLQRIKNDELGYNVIAVEIFPDVDSVVNDSTAPNPES